VVHLDETQDQYREKGLTVVAVTDEARAKVDAFVAATKARHAIVIESTDSAAAYGIQGFPSAYLIDVDGRIAWAGNFSQEIPPDLFERELAKVRLAPRLPAALTAAQPLLDGKKYAAAWAEIRKALDGGTLAGADKEAAEKGLAFIAETARKPLDAAAKLDASGDAGGAVAAYEKVAEDFKGSPCADEATAAVAAILAVPAKKKEVEGTRKWADVQRKIADMSPIKAIPVVRAFLMSYKQTRAGAEAKTRLEELERKAK
jgi:hypothetical protein